MSTKDYKSHMNTLFAVSAGAKGKGLFSTDGLMLYADNIGDECVVGSMLSVLASVAQKVGQINLLGDLSQAKITLAEGAINIIPLDNGIFGFFMLPGDGSNALTTHNG